MKRFVLLFGFFALLVSCSENSFEQYVFRTTADPFPDKPNVSIDYGKNQILLDWKLDEGCDEYILSKAEDESHLVFKTIYNGKLLSYVDSINQDDLEKRYIYKLEKKRGEQLFKNINVKYFGAGCCFNDEDSYEPNNDKNNATMLSSLRNATLTCVRYNAGVEPQIDEDWYYFDLPASYTANLELMQIEPAVTGMQETKLSIYYTDCISDKNIIHNDPIPIENDCDYTKRIYIKVYVKNWDDENIGSGYSQSVSYKIKIKNFVIKSE